MNKYHHRKNTGLICASMIAASLGIASAQSYSISSFGKTELVGTSAVPGGGTPGNFSLGTVTPGSSFAKFQMLNSSNTRIADLTVSLMQVYGTLNTASGRSGLMIAQTSNSQGLTDTGTLSILTGFSAAGPDGSSWVKLGFSFTEPDSVTPISLAQEITSFDYDFLQFLMIDKADFSASDRGSNVSRTDTASTIRFFDANNTDASFSQASNAVALNNVADDFYSFTVGKTQGSGNSLFMFEFRDPSINLATPLNPMANIPEPASAMLFGAAGILMLLRRKNR